MAVTDGAPSHRRSSWAPPTARRSAIGCDHADGVNLLPGRDLAERVAFARGTPWPIRSRSARFCRWTSTTRSGGDPSELAAIGVDRRTLYVGSPFPLDAIANIAAKLRAWNPASG